MIAYTALPNFDRNTIFYYPSHGPNPWRPTESEMETFRSRLPARSVRQQQQAQQDNKLGFTSSNGSPNEEYSRKVIVLLSSHENLLSTCRPPIRRPENIGTVIARTVAWPDFTSAAHLTGGRLGPTRLWLVKMLLLYIWSRGKTTRTSLVFPSGPR